MKTIFDAFLSDIEQKVTIRWTHTQCLGITAFYVQVWQDGSATRFRVTNRAPNGPCMMIKHTDALNDVIEALRQYVENCKEFALV